MTSVVVPSIQAVRELEYELYCARPLPVIDGTKCVKHVIFNKRVLHTFNRISVAGRRWFGLSNSLGIVLATTSLYVPPPARTILAIVSAPLHLVPAMMAFFVLRYDMVVVLIQTYEFWYFTLTNVLTAILLVLAIEDARSLVIVVVSIGYQVVLFMDANFRSTRAAVFAAMIGAGIGLSLTSGIVLDVVPDLREVTLMTFRQRTLEAHDVVSNSLVTMLVLGLRNAYRKHQRPEDKRDGTIVCCTFYCRLALREVECQVNRTQHSVVSSFHMERTMSWMQRTMSLSRTSSTDLGTAQLQMVPISIRFKANDTLWPPDQMRWLRSLLFGGRLGLVLNSCVLVSLCCVVGSFASPSPVVVQHCSIIAVLTAAVVCVTYLSFAHRKLIRRLCSSFDFLFVSVQFTVAHVCMADIVGWCDPRALSAAAMWLQLHWILTLDTVLPVYRGQRLGYRRWIPPMVLVVFIAEQLFFAGALLFASNTQEDPRFMFRDSLIVQVPTNNRVRQIRVVPLLFARFITTLWWSTRLLRRLMNGRESDGELLMLYGQVRYDNRAAARLLSKSVLPPVNLIPRS